MGPRIWQRADKAELTGNPGQAVTVLERRMSHRAPGGAQYVRIIVDDHGRAE